jgi:hypothetical protein
MQAVVVEWTEGRKRKSMEGTKGEGEEKKHVVSVFA